MPCLEPIPWRGEAVSRIILGTAQLGMDYGAANRSGKPDAAQARAIIETAWNAGIRHFDTAQAYGDSEVMLGCALRELGIADGAQVTTKLAMPEDNLDAATVRSAIEESRARLNVPQLWCVMLHTPRLLDHWNHGLGDALRELQAAGHIRHLGVSLSELNDAPRCLAHPDLAVLQLPCNAWDRRPIDSGLLERAQAADRLCCVRSLYLQGLLTMPPEAAATRLPAAKEASERWHAFAREHGMQPPELAIRFGLALDTPLVIGAETPEQVEATIAWAHGPAVTRELLDDLAARLAPSLEDMIISPWHWPE
ncbi:MAG: aldo/keto reductase [Candidatus Hydrogenedentota bacterium]